MEFKEVNNGKLVQSRAVHPVSSVSMSGLLSLSTYTFSNKPAIILLPEIFISNPPGLVSRSPLNPI